MAIKRVILRNLQVIGHNIYKLRDSWLTSQYGHIEWYGNQYGYEVWVWDEINQISLHRLMRIVEIVSEINKL